MAGFPEPDPNNVTLMDVANDIGVEWEQLATYLSFSSAEIGRLKMDYPHHSQTRTFQLLVRWRGRQDGNVNKRQVLRDALSSVGLQMVADAHLS